MNTTERPLRLALVRQRYNPFGGAERFIERALGALVREGAEITLITRDWSGAPREGFRQQRCDPGYSKLFGGRAARDRSFAKCAQREMRNGDYDITQSHERIPGCMIFRAGDGVHAAWLDHRGRDQSPLARYATRLAPFHRFILAQEAAMLAAPELRAVICNSVMVREEMRQYYDVPESKLVVIENGIDLDQYHPRVADLWRVKQREALGLDPDGPVFLYVGSGFARKGVPQLIEALARCRHRHSRLVIVGEDRHAAAYRTQAARLGLDARIIFAGPQKDVLPYYGMADAFVLPTRYDPMPNAALEALACGLPTITSTTCGIAARIRDGENGFVGDALDIDRLAAHLDILSAPGQADGMRAAARAAVADLGLGHMADELLNLYRRLR
ncbi:glycosyltransferase family 4 protein [Propionivibrio dicarboxylicus]|uniref:UDP-glucose:(Heptosyl)LPS alpha-1,3-glucosyltransferase n=1 Tax=Propionivibrio dicarboxylicus TaxID=83767 RepID=A0A1G8L199_9RHOO|nr:glycosyltransferase family 4 protein [Propionivibrio dicarboxylicus]SDI49442.1 UDP-glucose:(heptosyl)LPS alpha-1,3-glucosyltransferase [Propionivibrio dicarboxylicus]